MFALAQMTPVCVTVPTFLASFVTYWTTDLGTDAFELPLPTMWLVSSSFQCPFSFSLNCWNDHQTFSRFPFDVKSPFGYTIAVAIQFILSFNLDLTVACISIILIPQFLILISTVTDMVCGLGMLNTSARANESDFKIIEQFNQFVQFHSKVKELSESSSFLMKFYGTPLIHNADDPSF